MLKNFFSCFLFLLPFNSHANEPLKNTAAKTTQQAKTDASQKSAVTKKPEAQAPKTLTLGQKAPRLPENTKMLSYVSERKPWSNKDYEGKVSVLFYVAPNKKDLNTHATDAIRTAVDAGKISRDYYSSYAVINMAASSWPNFLIAIKLNQSQREFPNTSYVKDYERVLVEKWGLEDSSNCVVLFDERGTVLFRQDGKLSDKHLKTLVKTLEAATLKVAAAKTKKVSKQKKVKQPNSLAN